VVGTTLDLLRKTRRKIVRTEKFEQEHKKVWSIPARRRIDITVPMWRLHLECGHYVDVRRGGEMLPYRRGRRCTFCAHGHVVPKTEEVA